MPSILFFFGKLWWFKLRPSDLQFIFSHFWEHKMWQKNYINYSMPKWFTCLLLSLLTLSALLFLLIYWTSSNHKVLHLSLSWQEIHHQRSWRYSGSISLLLMSRSSFGFTSGVYLGSMFFLFSHCWCVILPHLKC